MEIRHQFPTGIVEMQPIVLSLGSVDADTALDAIERAKDDAWQIVRDFNAALNDAERLILNTGSIYGHKATAPLDNSASMVLCRTCTGSGLAYTFDYDTDRAVWGTCPDCGGSKLAGPVVHAPK